jgi:hypothetical protein
LTPLPRRGSFLASEGTIPSTRSSKPARFAPNEAVYTGSLAEDGRYREYWFHTHPDFRELYKE